MDTSDVDSCYLRSDKWNISFILWCLCTNTAVICDSVGLSNALRVQQLQPCLMHVCLEIRLACLCRTLWPICSLQPCSVSFAAFLQTVDELIGYYRGPACRLLLIYNNLFELWVVQSYSRRMWFLWSKELWMLCTLLLIRLSLFLSVRWAHLFVIRKAKETHRVLILRVYSKYLHIPLNSLIFKEHTRALILRIHTSRD